MAPWLFYLFATISVVSSIGVIGQRNPMYSVLLLIGSFISLAGLYVGLDSPFVAVTQIVVYAGAIMVLFLFVVMLLNAPHEDTEEDLERGVRPPSAGRVRVFGALLAIVLVGELIWVVLASRRAPIAIAGEGVSSVRVIGRTLFTDYAFPFEVTSVLILVALVGAVVLARRESGEQR